MKANTRTAIEVRCDSLLPTIIELNDWSDIEDVVQGPSELIPYPSQLKRKRVYIYVNENGILAGLPYNRWGLVGTFVIVRMSSDGRYLSFKDQECEAILWDLVRSTGYLDPSCKTMNCFREPFATHGEPPTGYAPPSGHWFSSSR